MSSRWRVALPLSAMDNFGKLLMVNRAAAETENRSFADVHSERK